MSTKTRAALATLALAAACAPARAPAGAVGPWHCFHVQRGGLEDLNPRLIPQHGACGRSPAECEKIRAAAGQTDATCTTGETAPEGLGEGFACHTRCAFTPAPHCFRLHYELVGRSELLCFESELECAMARDNAGRLQDAAPGPSCVWVGGGRL